MCCILEHCWWVWSLHPFALQSSFRQLLALNWIYVDTFIKLTILLLYRYKDADSAWSRTTLFVIWAIVATPGPNARDNQMMTQYAASTLLSPQQGQGTRLVISRKWQSWVYLVWPRVRWGRLFPVTCHQRLTNGACQAEAGPFRDKLHDLITALSPVNWCNALI